MIDIYLYSFLSIAIISLISIVGIIAISIKSDKLEKLLVYAIAFSAGALLGDAFIHLIPEAVEKTGFTLIISFYVLSGIGFSLITEKIIHWRHCHHPTRRLSQRRRSYRHCRPSRRHHGHDGS